VGTARQLQQFVIGAVTEAVQQYQRERAVPNHVRSLTCSAFERANRTPDMELTIGLAGRPSCRRRPVRSWERGGVRALVVVSGPPGAGKSTLAVPLSAALGFPLLSKDVIKETLFDALGHVDDDELASSRRLGAAAMELLWRLAEQFPAVVIEANLRSGSPYERERLRALSPRPVEVYCRLPADLAAERYADRGARPDHHAVHVLRSLPASAFEESQQPMRVGPVLEVDTSKPVDVLALASRIQAVLREVPDSGFSEKLGPMMEVTEQPTAVWVHPGVARARSTIDGDGLFTSQDLDVGVAVLRLGGRLVSSAELGALLATAGEDPGSGYVDTITVHDDAHLVLPPGTAAHWCNHSCDPNLWHVGAYEIAARRPIRAGEELTIDYGTHSGAAGFRMRCGCGSPSCRGEITSDDWQRPDLRARYRGHWTPALQARIDGLTVR
jgi:predicted kinase